MGTDPVALQQRWQDVTLATAEPWYRTTLAFDNGRLAEIDAVLDGQPHEPTSEFEFSKELAVAAGKDPEMLRAVLDVAGVLVLPEEVYGRPGVSEKAAELGNGWRSEQLPGPSRDELVALGASRA
jgi:hypothetical protein